MSSNATNDIFIAERPCFPSFYDWQSVPNKVRGIQDTSSKVSFNSNLSISSARTRINFLGMSTIAVPFVLLVRIPLRIIDLFCGDFITTGRELAEKQWKIERQLWSQNKIANLPDETRHAVLVRQFILHQLTKNILKIVFYPIALVGMQLATIYGAIVHPWDGQHSFQKIEDFFARDLPDSWRKSAMFYRLADYSAICMHPDQTWDKYDFFSTIKKVCPHTLRSHLRMLTHEITLNKAFLENEGVNVKEVLEQVSRFRADVKFLSIAEDLECDWNRDKKGDPILKTPFPPQLEEKDGWLIQQADFLKATIGDLENLRGFIKDLVKDRHELIEAKIKDAENIAIAAILPHYPLVTVMEEKIATRKCTILMTWRSLYHTMLKGYESISHSDKWEKLQKDKRPLRVDEGFIKNFLQKECNFFENDAEIRKMFEVPDKLRDSEHLLRQIFKSKG